MARARKFGAFGGVFTPSILTILGVIMFLRLPWIVGQAGLWSTLAIIFVAHIISVSTGLSISSVATDKRVERGGTYFIISRSLGLPIGGTLGLALFVGLSFSVSLYLIGFAEAFLGYFGFEITMQSIQIAGSIMLALVTLITIISTALAIKTQYLIMAAMALSLVSVFMGSHEMIPLAGQLEPMRWSLPWIALFAIFFPAVTGFEAGVSMSGDLKDARKDIPLGTISAILVGLIVYVGLAFFFSHTVDREQLVGNATVLFDIAWIPQLVIAGILGATLSSALGSILAAPRILQAIALDRVLPSFFSRGHGVSREPRNALLVTFAIAQVGILIGELNVIARIVTIFFIITYGFINITYAVESWAGSDFRPSFKIPRFVSIIGALACIIVMIQLDVLAMIGASLVLVLIFLFLKKKELTLQTGDTWNSIWASLVKTGLGRLATSSRKPRNWRPNVILFSGGEQVRPYLLEMGKSLVGKLGIFTNFELVENPSNEILFRKDEQIIPDAGSRKQKVFTRRHICADIYEGIDSISKIYGFSGFEPNTILMGWGRRTRDPQKFSQLLMNFKKLDYNTVFLHYDKVAGFGNYRQIDFWWNGKGRNLALALTLMRFITSSKEWRTACLRIMVINREVSQTENYYSLINQLLDNYRMTAIVKVISNGVEQLSHNSIIHNHSSNTDLTILELPEGNRREPQQIIQTTNLLTENLGTCLIIHASSFFEEINIVGISPFSVSEKQVNLSVALPDVIKQLQVSPREFIANEIHNIAKVHTHHAQKFQMDIFESIEIRNAEYFKNIHEFTNTTFGKLLKTLALENTQIQNREALRLLNDFSYHTQWHIKEINERQVVFEREVLQRAISQYLSVLRHSISVVPENIRIRLPGSAFDILPEDGLKNRIYKLGKKVQATITRKPVVHKIRVTQAARYYLFYRRLEWLHSFLTEFSTHSFREVASIRKLLTELHQTIEISRREVGFKHKAGDRAKMERDRLIASIAVMQKENRVFFFQAATNMYEALREDLQQFNNYLDSPGTKPVEIFSASVDHKAISLQEDIEDYPENWKSSMELFVNKILLDFLMLSLKNRILSRVNKYKEDMKLEIETALLNPMRTYKVEELDGVLVVPGKKKKEGFLDHSLIKNPNLPGLFDPLFTEITGLVSGLPEVIAISNPGVIEKIELGHKQEARPVEINLRKSAAFFLGAELFDKARKQIDEGQQQIQKSIYTLKDLVRLVNFNLEGDTDQNDDISELQIRTQNQQLMQSFHQRLREEQASLINLYREIEKAFDQGLKKAFEPLSSATITTNNIALKKKVVDQPGLRFTDRIHHNFLNIRKRTQQQFVKLLYSKSEGMLWVNRYELEKSGNVVSNTNFLTFAETLTPSQEVEKGLPHYYSSLFSGQSGVGEGFWVGMKEEIHAAEQAVMRFSKGVAGALIVTGERSSGKSSLCKFITKKHFPPGRVFSLRSPKSCNSNVDSFTEAILDLFNMPGSELENVFDSMDSKTVLIINDLELWWERKPNGLEVIKLIQDLVDRFGHKCLFVINSNIHALKIIDRALDLRSLSLDTIICQPFDARELKDIVLLRHQAGGLRFILDNKSEDKMSEWDYAQLFNKYFDLSRGNPGSAIALWLASIKRIQGKNIYMETISLQSEGIFEQLTHEQLFYILQFVLHRRLTAQQVSDALQVPLPTALGELRKLLRAAILIERFDEVYSLNRSMEIPIVEKLKSLNLL